MNCFTPKKKLDIDYKEYRVYKQTTNDNYKPKPNKRYDSFQDTTNPDVWGPLFWFTLHNGASVYPIQATEIQKDMMRGFIYGIPSMLPCNTCKIHANNYIQSHNIDNIIKGRESLFKWFVDFHNKVNVRTNKRYVPLEEAKAMYNIS